MDCSFYLCGLGHGDASFTTHCQGFCVSALCFVYLYFDEKGVSQCLVASIVQKVNELFEMRQTYFACLGADCDVDTAAHHVAAVFSACNMASSRPVYHHFSTAIDSEIMKQAFHMVIDQIIKENLSAVQLL